MSTKIQSYFLKKHEIREKIIKTLGLPELDNMWSYVAARNPKIAAFCFNANEFKP